jgi:hypothetical protein
MGRWLDYVAIRHYLDPHLAKHASRNYDAFPRVLTIPENFGKMRDETYGDNQLNVERDPYYVV